MELKQLINNEDRIPKEYRISRNLTEIRKDLIELFDSYEVTNPHIINLRSLLFPSKKIVTKVEILKEKHKTGDLSISEDSHSYWANGIPVHNTINLPANYPIEDFDNLFRRMHAEGARGVTTYREGTMIAVLETKKEAAGKKEEVVEQQAEFYDIFTSHERGTVITDDVSLPEEYPMKGYKIVSEGKKWYLHVAFKDPKMKRPFAIFVQTNNRESDVNAQGAIEALSELAASEGILTYLIEDNDKKMAGNTNVNKIARCLAMLLRHNVKIERIVKTLDLLEVPVSSFVYRIKKFLMQFIDELENGMKCPQCGETVQLQDGCISCPHCQWTKC